MEQKKLRTKQDDEMFWRLNSYFHALKHNELPEYHKKHKRGIDKY